MCVCLVTQSCPTLGNPMNCSPLAPVSMGILQARMLEWAAMPSSRGSSQPRDQTQVSCIVGGFFTTWATRKAQEYWSGLPCPSPGDLPDTGIEPGASLYCRWMLYQLKYKGSPIQDHTAASLTCSVNLARVLQTSKTQFPHSEKQD